MMDDFRGVSEQALAEQVSELKRIIRSGDFKKTAGSTFDISPKALIKLSDEVDVNPTAERKKPTFDLIISPDPLTIRVANRLYPELQRMGFKPVLIIGEYKLPGKTVHPQLQELAYQTQVFNQVVFDVLGTSTSSDRQFLTPTHLKHVKGLKVLDGIGSVNERSNLSYIEDEGKNVGVAHTFRLYDRIGKPFIELFSKVSDDGRKTLWGEDDRHLRKTCFTSPYADPIHRLGSADKDEGTRRSVTTNIHPSMKHHGVIPPFWTQLRMLELMRDLNVNYGDYSPEEIAEICIKHDVNPYLNGMVHHIEPRFDTGDRILIAQNGVPVDLSKPMWENYFAMEEMIVDATLGMAASYKLALNLSGHSQTLQNTEYHSYPGTDSQPPAYMPDQVREDIKAKDRDSMTVFEDLGGVLSSKAHFESVIYGDPETGTPGFVVPGTPTAKRLKQRIDSAYADRRYIRNGTQIGGGGSSDAAIQIVGDDDFSVNDNNPDDVFGPNYRFGPAPV